MFCETRVLLSVKVKGEQADFEFGDFTICSNFSAFWDSGVFSNFGTFLDYLDFWGFLRLFGVFWIVRFFFRILRFLGIFSGLFRIQIRKNPLVPPGLKYREKKRIIPLALPNRENHFDMLVFRPHHRPGQTCRHAFSGFLDHGIYAQKIIKLLIASYAFVSENFIPTITFQSRDQVNRKAMNVTCHESTTLQLNFGPKTPHNTQDTENLIKK